MEKKVRAEKKTRQKICREKKYVERNKSRNPREKTFPEKLPCQEKTYREKQVEKRNVQKKLCRE